MDGSDKTTRLSLMLTQPGNEAIDHLTTARAALADHIVGTPALNDPLAGIETAAREMDGGLAGVQVSMRGLHRERLVIIARLNGITSDLLTLKEVEREIFQARSQITTGVMTPVSGLTVLDIQLVTLRGMYEIP